MKQEGNWRLENSAKTMALELLDRFKENNICYSSFNHSIQLKELTNSLDYK